MMVGISVLSGSAGVQTGSWSFAGIDKAAHFVIFGLLGVAWFRSLDAGAFPGLVRLVRAVGLTTLFGLLDELHQFHNPLRTFEWADLGADFAGSLAVTAAYFKCRPLRELLELELRYLLRLRFQAKPAKSSQ